MTGFSFIVLSVLLGCGHDHGEDHECCGGHGHGEDHECCCGNHGA